MDIILQFSAPVILESDNGSEFSAMTISEMKQLWLDMKLFHGNSHHPQFQGSVECTNGDIKDILVVCMADNYNSQDWATGIKFVQFQQKLMCTIPGSNVRHFQLCLEVKIELGSFHHPFQMKLTCEHFVQTT